MAFLYSTIYLILVAGPLGLVIWQTVIRKDHVLNRKIVWLTVAFLILIVVEAVFGKSGQQALVVEKMAAISAIVSLFSVSACLILRIKGSRWLLCALIIGTLSLIFFTFAGGYRNFLEAWCYVAGQRCFTGTAMYLR